MKKMITVLLFVLTGWSSTVIAAGAHVEGFVDISERSDGSMSMLASMNNRYNSTDTAIETLMFALPAQEGVTFFGRDATGTQFMCNVYPGSQIFDYAFQVALNVRHGSVIRVSKEVGSNECSFVTMLNGSLYLD